MDNTQSTAAYQTKIMQVVFGLLFAGAGLYAVQSLMHGSRSVGLLIVSVIVTVAVSIILDARYWLLAPVLMTGIVKIPGLPFDGWELACLSVSAIHFIRLALHRDSYSSHPQDVLPVVPLLCWMVIVFLLNPTGVALVGSTSIGGRFYFKVALGFFALLALSGQRIDETGSKWMFWSLVCCFVFKLIHGVIFPPADPDAIVFSGVQPEVSARYAFITASLIFTLLFSKYSFKEILSSPWFVMLMGGLALLTVYSGKRSAFARLALIPVFRTVLTGREKFLTFFMTILAVILMIVAVAGDGAYYELPQSAKRALSVLESSYSSRGVGGFHDEFRAYMRERARETIRRDPLFGRKGFGMNLNEAIWVNSLQGPFEGHALAGAWHSALYAYPADFGLPGLFFFLVFAWFVLRYVFRAARIVITGTYMPTMCLYCCFELLCIFAFSYTSGHASMTTMELMLRYGLLIAVVRGYQEQQRISVE